MDADVEGLVVLGACARRAREAVEGRVVALSRVGVAWWEGPAADAFRDLVDERRAVLGRLAGELAAVEAEARAGVGAVP